MMKATAIAFLMLAVCLLPGRYVLAGQPDQPSACLPDVASQRVLSLDLPGGGQRHVDEFRLDLQLATATESLAVASHQLALPGHLMRQRVGQWHTFSFWFGKRFCVIQVRALGASQTYGLLTLTDYGNAGHASRDTHAGTATSRFEPPLWWPRFRAAKMQRWSDAGKRVTTITGLSANNLTSTRVKIVQAARRGGFLPSAQMQVPSSAIGRPGFGQQGISEAGLMLMFRSATGELVVTLTALPRITSVVAHLEEK